MFKNVTQRRRDAKRGMNTLVVLEKMLIKGTNFAALRLCETKYCAIG